MKTTLRKILLPQPKSKIKAGEGQTKGKYKFFTSSSIQSKYYNCAEYSKPSLIFGTGGLASVHFCNEPFSTSTDCLVMYGIENTNLELIYHYLHNNINILQAGFKGAGLQHISKDYILDIEVDLPDMDTQIKIVRQMNLIDNLIITEKKQIKFLDKLVKSRFTELFGDLKTNSKGWEIKTFDELTDIITDGEHITPKRASEGIYLLSARNILNHSIKLDEVDYINQEEYTRISRRIIPQKGDVLISCSGSVGRCCSVVDEFKFQMVRSVALLRFKKFITPVFAEYMITSDYLQEQISNLKTSSSQANLFQGKIKVLKGVVPPLDLQNQFAEFVKQSDKSKLAVERSLKELETLKKSLMQKYFG